MRLDFSCRGTNWTRWADGCFCRRGRCFGLLHRCWTSTSTQSLCEQTHCLWLCRYFIVFVCFQMYSNFAHKSKIWIDDGRRACECQRRDGWRRLEHVVIEGSCPTGWWLLCFNRWLAGRRWGGGARKMRWADLYVAVKTEQVCADWITSPVWIIRELHFTLLQHEILSKSMRLVVWSLPASSFTGTYLDEHSFWILVHVYGFVVRLVWVKIHSSWTSCKGDWHWQVGVVDLLPILYR